MKHLAVLATTAAAVGLLSATAAPADAATGTFIWRVNGQTTELKNPKDGSCHRMPGGASTQVVEFTNKTNRRASVFQGTTSCDSRGPGTVHRVDPGGTGYFTARSDMSVRIWTS